MHRNICWLMIFALAWALPAHAAKKKKKAPEISPLDVYLQEALKEPQQPVKPSPGSLWSPSSRLTELGSDVRAAQVDDLVTIVVRENASAVATGATKTSRASSAQSSVSSLLGVKSAAGALSNLLNANSATALDGQGTTTRGATLTDTLSARVTHVLPNGYLVVEATKNLMVNSERQVVSVRGVIRPADLSPGNIISSSQIAQVEIKIDGKGVVNDSVRRPNIIYRILLGLLPF
ncbi:MAG TPA: flagellar basal body L-ring protein FlgH [Bryobacteraceae bacterium]|nr:flagellar basal body L-ring protein FlgH [Bryobacteraceae bacterium]